MAHASVIAPSPSTAPDANLLRGRLMQHALTRLLNQVPHSRSALPHLGAFEKGLGRYGIEAIQRVSAAGLSKIHTQLRVLPLDSADPTIQDLLSRIQNALRRHAARQAAMGQTVPVAPQTPIVTAVRPAMGATFDPEATMVITEVTEADFMEALEEVRRQTELEETKKLAMAEAAELASLQRAEPQRV